jgi:hypothetical protein
VGDSSVGIVGVGNARSTKDEHPIAIEQPLLWLASKTKNAAANAVSHHETLECVLMITGVRFSLTDGDADGGVSNEWNGME